MLRSIRKTPGGFKSEVTSVVAVMSRRAEIQASAFVTPTVQPGQVFIPMHYREANRLTYPAFDSYSRRPSHKACAVRIEAR